MCSEGSSFTSQSDIGKGLRLQKAVKCTKEVGLMIIPLEAVLLVRHCGRGMWGILRRHKYIRREEIHTVAVPTRPQRVEEEIRLKKKNSNFSLLVLSFFLFFVFFFVFGSKELGEGHHTALFFFLKH